MKNKDELQKSGFTLKFTKTFKNPVKQNKVVFEVVENGDKNTKINENITLNQKKSDILIFDGSEINKNEEKNDLIITAQPNSNKLYNILNSNDNKEQLNNFNDLMNKNEYCHSDYLNEIKKLPDHVILNKKINIIE